MAQLQDDPLPKIRFEVARRLSHIPSPEIMEAPPLAVTSLEVNKRVRRYNGSQVSAAFRGLEQDRYHYHIMLSSFRRRCFYGGRCVPIAFSACGCTSSAGGLCFIAFDAPDSCGVELLEMVSVCLGPSPAS